MPNLYHKLCHDHGFSLDPAQEMILQKLEELSESLENHNRRPKWRKWFCSASSPKGLYIYGGVGRGKTMLMDLFFRSINVDKKYRVHFHTFMQQIHQRLKELGNKTNAQQPIIEVASQWKKKADLICFDEFHITDIADAMILSRLFDCLWNLGIVVVMTSNFKPEDLYPNGLHRERLYPFFEKLYHYMDVRYLDSTIDYRRELLSHEKRYFYPLNPATQSCIKSIYHRLTHSLEDSPVELIVQGRRIPVQQACGGVSLFSFDALCETPRGRDDYLILVQHYTTLILENIPYFSQDNQSAAKRFITLIDILYDQGTNLVVSAADSPDKLHQGGINAELFKRTTSRLVEMTGCQ